MKTETTPMADALERVREEVRREYREQIAEAEKKKAEAERIIQFGSYYVDHEKPSSCFGFKLTVWPEDLTAEEQGKLVAAFNENNFFRYDLLIRHFIANDQKGKYELWAIPQLSCMKDDQRIARDDYAKMTEFVRGFTLALISCRQPAKGRYILLMGSL